MHKFIGQSKSLIIEQLQHDLNGAHYVEFGCWLYVCDMGVLLSFHKQHCCTITHLP